MLSAVIGFGELLWDMLPSGRALGGAPANFAYQVMKQGLNAYPISCVGPDTLGVDALRQLESAGIDIRGIGRCELPTGTVDVYLDSLGVPQYDIHEGVAWDALQLTDHALEVAKSAAAICFGTLAQRTPGSSDVLNRVLALLPTTAVRVFDVNLRQQYFNAECLHAGCHHADVLKLNDEELPVVCALLNIDFPTDVVCQTDDSLRGTIDRLRKEFALKTIAITYGARGSLVAAADTWSWIEAESVAVVDTIGAGDAFTAGLVAGILSGESTLMGHQRAQDAAIKACLHRGAMGYISGYE